jgi:hypothetical protein
MLNGIGCRKVTLAVRGCAAAVQLAQVHLPAVGEVDVRLERGAGWDRGAVRQLGVGGLLTAMSPTSR